MPRRTIQQARAKNAMIRRRVDAAKARGHAIQDLVELENGKWCTSCSCGWESHQFHTQRHLAAEIGWHLGWASGDKPAPDGVSQPPAVGDDL